MVLVSSCIFFASNLPRPFLVLQSSLQHLLLAFELYYRCSFMAASWPLHQLSEGQTDFYDVRVFFSETESVAPPLRHEHHCKPMDPII